MTVWFVLSEVALHARGSEDSADSSEPYRILAGEDTDLLHPGEDHRVLEEYLFVLVHALLEPVARLERLLGEPVWHVVPDPAGDDVGKGDPRPANPRCEVNPEVSVTHAPGDHGQIAMYLLAQLHICHQLFLNLFINSVDAMPNGGELSVTADTITTTETFFPNKVEICVADTGEGISPEVLSKIFDPFFTTKPPGRDGYV